MEGVEDPEEEASMTWEGSSKGLATFTLLLEEATGRDGAVEKVDAEVVECLWDSLLLFRRL